MAEGNEAELLDKSGVIDTGAINQKRALLEQRSKKVKIVPSKHHKDSKKPKKSQVKKPPKDLAEKQKTKEVKKTDWFQIGTLLINLVRLLLDLLNMN